MMEAETRPADASLLFAASVKAATVLTTVIKMLRVNVSVRRYGALYWIHTVLHQRRKE